MDDSSSRRRPRTYQQEQVHVPHATVLTEATAASSSGGTASMDESAEAAVRFLKCIFLPILFLVRLLLLPFLMFLKWLYLKLQPFLRDSRFAAVDTLIKIVLCHYTGRRHFGRIYLVLAALGYVASPIDIIPDFIMGIGWTDDAAVLWWVQRVLRDEIHTFDRWEQGLAEPLDVPALTEECYYQVQRLGF
jgi:uncharacterized membrane protein YkvA (DUF1232 family)